MSFGDSLRESEPVRASSAKGRKVMFMIDNKLMQAVDDSSSMFDKNSQDEDDVTTGTADEVINLDDKDAESLSYTKQELYLDDL